MARARTLTLKTKVEVTGADKLKGLGDRLQSAGAKMTLFVTTPLALLGNVARKAASDLNESMNAINVTFADSSDEIAKLGETSAETWGLSTRAFNQAATQFSASAHTIAGEGGDVARVIEDITGRASDFASVHNLEVADALALFQSGLAGETEPLRRYGVDLSAAAVEAHALATGIAEGNQPLTEAQKLQARYSLLLEKTSNVQGDFANTSGDAANATRIAAARAEDAAAALGQRFLPIQEKVIGVLNAAIDAWEKLPAPVQDAVVVFGVAAAALGPLLGIVGTLLKPISLLWKLLASPAPAVGATRTATALGGLRAALLGLAGPIAAAVGALAAITAIGTDLHSRLAPIEHEFNEVASQVGLSRVAIEGEVNRLAQSLGVSADEIRTALTEALSGGATWDEAVAGIEQAGNDIVDGVGNTADRVAEEGKRIPRELTAAVTGGKPEVEAAATTSLMDPVVTALLGGKEEAERIAGETPGAISQALLDNQFSVEDAARSLQEAVENGLHPMIERTQILAFLASDELQKGLASGIPAVRQRALELKAAAEARLIELGDNAFNYGYNFGAEYAAGIVNSLGVVADAGRQLASTMHRTVAIESEPDDPNSPLHGITKWGGNLARTYAEGIMSGLSAVRSAAGAMAGAAVPAASRTSATAATMVPGASVVNNFYITYAGDPRSPTEAQEIVSDLQRLSPLIGGKLAPGW